MHDSAPPFRFGRGEWVVLALLAVLGLVTVPQPFAWDQAMFTIGARKLAAGAVLYRDYWDPKQPAMFTFYWLGGRLFGFTEVGEHVFELLYLLAFAAAILWVIGDHLGHVAGRATALLSIGMFLLVCNDALHAQIECLAGLPLLLALEFAARATERRASARWLALSGLAGGVALTFKLLLLPIPLAFWLAALWDLRARGSARLAAAAAALAAGVAVPLAACAAYFALHGALAIAWWTSVPYPLEVIKYANEPRLRTLMKSAMWFARYWAPIGGASVVGLAMTRLWPAHPRARGMALWIACAALVLLVQKLSYWPYHFFIFIVPLAYFAARGLPALAAWIAAVVPVSGGARRALLAAVAVVALLPALALWFAGAILLVRDGGALTPDSLRRHLDAASPGGVYGKVRAETTFLSEPDARPGAIWVVGNPLYYWLSGREQSIPRNGGSFIEYAPAHEWEGVTASLAAAHPAYIYVHDDFGKFLTVHPDRSASFLALLRRDYTVARHTSHGVWYQPSAAARENKP